MLEALWSGVFLPREVFTILHRRRRFKPHEDYCDPSWQYQLLTCCFREVSLVTSCESGI